MWARLGGAWAFLHGRERGVSAPATAAPPTVLAQALQPMRSVVYALLSTQGVVVVANAGFCHVCCVRQAQGADARAMADAVGRNVAACFASPRFEAFDTAPGADGALLYQGLLSLCRPDGYAVSLRASVHRRGDCLELLAEHDIAENEQLLASTLSLNAELAHMQRDLARANRAQASLLAKLEAAQGQLLQQEKLVSIGQLAAGVAHEINNPIAFVSANLTALEGYLQDLWAVLDAYASATPLIAHDAAALAAIAQVCQARDLAFIREDVPSLLAQSRDGLLRVKNIVQNLKDFSRVDQAQWQLADLHEGLDSTLALAAAQWQPKAEVVRAYGDLPPLRCAPAQLNQVFLNLLLNAVQSIAERGSITVRTGRDGDGAVQWGWVELEDTGCGIAPNQLHRLFEPFYTTKPVGQGMGLGLSLCYGIVAAHGGRIEVHSVLGVGSRFRVWLPLAPPETLTDTQRIQ